MVMVVLDGAGIDVVVPLTRAPYFRIASLDSRALLENAPYRVLDR